MIKKIGLILSSTTLFACSNGKKNDISGPPSPPISSETLLEWKKSALESLEGLNIDKPIEVSTNGMGHLVGMIPNIPIDEIGDIRFISFFGANENSSTYVLDSKTSIDVNSRGVLLSLSNSICQDLEKNKKSVVLFRQDGNSSTSKDQGALVVLTLDLANKKATLTPSVARLQNINDTLIPILTQADPEIVYEAECKKGVIVAVDVSTKSALVVATNGEDFSVVSEKNSYRGTLSADISHASLSIGGLKLLDGGSCDDLITSFTSPGLCYGRKRFNDISVNQGSLPHLKGITIAQRIMNRAVHSVSVGIPDVEDFGDSPLMYGSYFGGTPKHYFTDDLIPVFKPTGTYSPHNTMKDYDDCYDINNSNTCTNYVSRGVVIYIRGAGLTSHDDLDVLIKTLSGGNVFAKRIKYKIAGDLSTSFPLSPGEIGVPNFGAWYLADIPSVGQIDEISISINESKQFRKQSSVIFKKNGSGSSGSIELQGSSSLGDFIESVIFVRRSGNGHSVVYGATTPVYSLDLQNHLSDFSEYILEMQ